MPANAWDGAAWVPNTGGYSLAQLWAGVGGLRATPEQEHALIPRAVEYTAGFMKFLWDFVNPPPHLSGVRIEQDQNGDGAIDPGADEVICRPLLGHDQGPDTFSLRTTRTLRKSAEAPAMRLPVRIELRFSEPVRNVTVALGIEAPTLVVGRDLVSERGPPTDDHPDGAPRLVLPDVDLSALPDGTITLFVTAEDLSNHATPVASALDPDPSTRAGRLPDGSWRNIEGGGAFPDTDRNHSFKLGGMEVRGAPSFGQCFPGQPVVARHPGQEPGTPGREPRRASGSPAAHPAGARTLTRSRGSGSPCPRPAPAGSRPAPRSTSPATSPGSRLETFVAAAAGHTTAIARIFDLTAVAPLGDHPDDTQSVTNRRFPTPWPVDTASPIGILLNGWGAGIGHLLGRYGIATAPVSPDLRILDGGGADIDALEVLVVGSGGLAGLDRLPSFRERLERFVERRRRADRLHAAAGGGTRGAPRRPRGRLRLGRGPGLLRRGGAHRRPGRRARGADRRRARRGRRRLPHALARRRDDPPRAHQQRPARDDRLPPRRRPGLRADPLPRLGVRRGTVEPGGARARPRPRDGRARLAGTRSRSTAPAIPSRWKSRWSTAPGRRRPTCRSSPARRTASRSPRSPPGCRSPRAASPPSRSRSPRRRHPASTRSATACSAPEASRARRPGTSPSSPCTARTPPAAPADTGLVVLGHRTERPRAHRRRNDRHRPRPQRHSAGVRGGDRRHLGAPRRGAAALDARRTHPRRERGRVPGRLPGHPPRSVHPALRSLREHRALPAPGVPEPGRRLRR